MLSQIFLGMSLIGAEWVLYLLILLSIVSVAVMFERFRFYQLSQKGLSTFRQSIRSQVAGGKYQGALDEAKNRLSQKSKGGADLESELTYALLEHKMKSQSSSPEILSELAVDAVGRSRILWDRNLAILATIGNIAPFIGLFGTVLGIIKAFHDLSLQGGGAAQMVTSGISEALVATAVGLLVAIPASVAFNLFQRRVRSALMQAESLKSFLIGKIGAP